MLKTTYNTLATYYSNLATNQNIQYQINEFCMGKHGTLFY